MELVPPAAQPWWQPMLGDGLSIRCALVGAAALVGLACSAGVLRRLATARQADVATGDAGTATIEFVLVTPVLLFMVLTLIQTTLVMGANIYVHGAALAATRSAIVQIPRDLSDVTGERPNAIDPSPASPKYAAIRRAAVYALLPVGGPGDGDRPEAQAYAAAIEHLYASYGRTVPNWVQRLAPGRLAWALDHTEVDLLRAHEDDADGVRFGELAPNRLHTFGPKDPVTVRVGHRLHLSMPLAHVIFADTDPDTGHRGRDMFLRAQYTLTNEGIAETLPTPPTLPRVP